MKTSSDDEFSFRDIPSPVFKGFLEKLKSMEPERHFIYNVPCQFSSRLGDRTWNLYYRSGDQTLIAKEYDHTTIEKRGYQLDSGDLVEWDFTVRTGKMKLLREFKYECDISFSRNPQIKVVIQPTSPYPNPYLASRWWAKD